MADAFLISLWIAAGGYACVIAVLAWATARGAAPGRGLAGAELPTVAVIVAARDEEVALPRCLAALTALNYPPDRIEIIVADDHSTDGTPEVVRRFEPAVVAVGAADPAPPEPVELAQPGALDVRYLRVPEPEGHVRGKALALDAAIATTDAELLLFTDADCAPEPDWVRRLAAPFADPDVGLVCGLTVLDVDGHLADATQALDWALMLTAVGALTELGVPATGMGNNMAVRREAYHATGGYPALPFSVTEDFALYRAVVDKTPFAARFRLAPDALVRSEPAPSLRAAYGQRRRWARGGLGGGAPVWAAYVALHLSHLLPVVALGIAPLHGLAALAAMLTADRLLLGAANRRTGGGLDAALSPAAFALSVAFRFGYLLTLPLVLLVRPRITWKGRAH